MFRRVRQVAALGQRLPSPTAFCRFFVPQVRHVASVTVKFGKLQPPAVRTLCQISTYPFHENLEN